MAEFQEKPLATQGLISGGFFVFNRRFVERLPDRDDLYLEHANPLTELAHDGELAAYRPRRILGIVHGQQP